jgi:allophanate hydrolase
MSAVLEIEQCGPFVSLQDRGRFGFMRFGVTESGPMDRASHALAQSAVDGTGPILEVSLGGISLRCVSGQVTCAIAGGAFTVLLDGQEHPPWSVLTLTEGSRLKIRPGPWGSWCYVAFAGEVTAPDWLGSQSTHMDTGLCGMPFKQGDVITVNKATTLPDRLGEMCAADPFKPSDTIRVVMGPQDRFFDEKSINDLTTKTFDVTPEYNRMGMRLSGPKLEVNAALDMPSEPIARGSLQIPGHGDPLCLMADHGTAGGYPKIATVISADFDVLAQMRVGDTLRFKAITADEAVKAARARRDQIEATKAQIKAAQVSLETRLWANNLISGVVTTEPD